MTAWRKLGEAPVRDGFRSILTRRFELPDGRQADFEIKLEPVVATVLPLTDDGHVILVEQFRPGPEAVLLELPGGAVEPGEAPLDAARRELLEETGYVGQLAQAGTSLECAYSTRVRHTFVARGCVRVQAPAGDATEFGLPVLVSLGEFRAHLRGGRLTDVESGYLGLDFLGLL